MIINLVDFDKDTTSSVSVCVKKSETLSSEQRWKIYKSNDSTINVEGTVNDLEECVEIVLTNKAKDKILFHHPV